MYPKIGSYDAKTKLPELLREVREGRRYTITLRGKPVANLVPVGRFGEDNIRRAVAAMHALPRIKGVDAADLQRAGGKPTNHPSDPKQEALPFDQATKGRKTGP
jgi:prevent-host-death family protein